MAPKNLPPAAKSQKILEFFQNSMNVYTLKELEKCLQSVAAINGMQVKEYLQALHDENLIRVEKIGSGNWYWCFTSDSKKAKENKIENLKAEENKLLSAIADTEKQIDDETAKRNDNDEMLDDQGLDRKALLEAHEGLLKEMEALDKDLACYSEHDPAEISLKTEESKKFRNATVRCTDNIEALESFISQMLNDRTQVANLMAQSCGNEYVAGEGLKDLGFHA